MKDISLHLMDIIQNSISAKASKITVNISASVEEDELLIKVADNGTGMDKELLEQVSDPFVTTRVTRRIGLGISLLKASAQRASGKLEISSVKGMGTTVSAKFSISHIDRIPLGSIAETMIGVIAARPEIEWELVLSSNKGKLEFSTAEVKSRLEGLPITQFEVITWIREFIDEGVNSIFGGVLDEITG